jgi:phenylpropionate dioxygenase-like ring-hydroxylating dioxygenase large terminal subunit
MPMGWYRMVDSGDLHAGDVLGVRYLGRDLVVWRDGGGAPVVQDAVCPHLGAHLGVGGHLTDGCLTCPFHGWRFDATGACVEIPYSERVNRRAHLPAYPTVERNGFVFAWYHPAGVAPLWEVPAVEQYGDVEWSDYLVSEHVVRTIPQEMAENSVDPAHFRFVHGTSVVAEIEEYRTEGFTATMLSKQGYVTPKGDVEGRIDVHSYGPGFGLTWFRGILDALLVSCTTPIDGESTVVRFNFTVRKPVTRLAELFVAEIDKQIGQDIPIWEHKLYLPVPALADTDGPIMQFRRWYAQFYANADGTPFSAGEG